MANKQRRFALALAFSAVAVVLAAPAGAQFSAGRITFDWRDGVEPVQFREFFRGWGGGGGYPSNPTPLYNPFYPRPQVYEPTRPPPPRKVETPSSETILVIGDSLAEWLGYGLEEILADTPEVGIARRIKPTAGLVRYEGRIDGPDWPQAVKDMLATDKPAAIIVMLGLNDRLPLRERAPDKDKDKDKDKKGSATSPAPQGPADAAPPQPDVEQPASIIAAEKDRRAPGGYYEFRADRWADLYEKRVDDMIAALKSKGVPVIWVGLPALRGTKSTSDMSYLDEIYRARAEKAGIIYVDPWDGFVDEKGQFTLQGPDFEGQIRRLRTSDGVNFTKVGAEKLARYVERDLRRALMSHVMPVALPGPEEQTPAKGNVRPAVGPILPLNVTSGGEGGDLLGGGSRQVQHESDPIATQVLSRGEAIAAPKGRADDFSWPRPDAASTADLTPAPIAAAPAVSAGKGAAGKNDTKNDTTKADTKKSGGANADGKNPLPVSANAAPAKPRRPGSLDGAPPRPPLPVGPSRD